MAKPGVFITTGKIWVTYYYWLPIKGRHESSGIYCTCLLLPCLHSIIKYSCFSAHHYVLFACGVYRVHTYRVDTYSLPKCIVCKPSITIFKNNSTLSQMYPKTFKFWNLSLQWNMVGFILFFVINF